MQKSQGVTGKHTDQFIKFQEYFRGKSYQVLLKQEQIENKIKIIEMDVK